MNRVAGWRMSQGSLRSRMLVSATFVLLTFVAVMGLVLDNAFQKSAEQSVAERLLLHIYALIAVSDLDEQQDSPSLFLPQALQEPDFNRMGSGLFAVVFDQRGQEIWRSVSALDLLILDQQIAPMLDQLAPGIPRFDRIDPIAGSAMDHHNPMFFLSYRVIWQSALSESQFVFVVLQEYGPFYNEVAAFRNSLWGLLVAGVVILIAVQAAIMYWGLLPLGQLANDLQAIEVGKQDYLEGHYPQEIEGVTRSLNLLLAGERQQRERYRTTLADLAHSLKTPLAILKAEAGRPEQSMAEMTRSLDEQVNRMDELISYQLERAVTHSSRLINQSVDIAPVVLRLVTALEKVYRGKNMLIEHSDVSGNFPGDERDLLELCGNLLDNGCKYGRTQVSLRVSAKNNLVTLVVEDDGPGISVDERERVLKRGARLDTHEPGQGIGLAVVAEIVARYQGEIGIDASSSLGGTMITVRFPS